MASSYETFKDLDITRDEVERITDALKNKEFRQLLVDYVEDIQNPDNQKIFQEEVTQLEKERGVDVTFINPGAGYVIKTSVDGSKKAFVNVCSNENVKKPVSSPMVREGSRGLQWSLPHSLAPPREDIDKKGVRCVVFDVIFHPDTLHLVKNNKAFRDMVNNTACDAVESNFNVTLDKLNLKFPKLQYKGFPQPAVVRKPSKVPPPELPLEEKEFMDKLYAQIDEAREPHKNGPKKKGSSKRVENDLCYTTPKYVIKHRKCYEMDEFTNHKEATLNVALPKELVVEITLPLLKSSSDIVLDVADKTLAMISEKPAKYKLSLTLPYSVNQDCGNAKFDTDKKQLVVTLPVTKRQSSLPFEREDSGVESDHSPLPSSPLDEMENVAETLRHVKLDSNYQYSLPEFSATVSQNDRTLIFTVNVKNVDGLSLQKLVNDSDFQVRFCSISSGFYSVHYALYVEIVDCVLDPQNTVVDVWDNNLTLQIPYDCDKQPAFFLYGLDRNDRLTQKTFNSLINTTHVPDAQSPVSSPIFKRNRKRDKKETLSNPIDISGTSESSGDELSRSLSPGRGILKFIRAERRTVSESGLDEVKWASSLENNFTSVDSVIPEEGEISSSLKKSVRFNDVVSRKLYRSNSSILGQRKKNQRKAKAKKRAHERRHSESEISETEEIKERDAETAIEIGGGNTDGGSIESNFNSEIFELLDID